MRFKKNNVEIVHIAFIYKEDNDYYVNIIWNNENHILTLTKQEILDIKSLIDKVFKNE